MPHYVLPTDTSHGYLVRNLTTASESVRNALVHLNTPETIDCHPRVRAAIRLLVDADTDISHAYQTLTKQHADATAPTA